MPIAWKLGSCYLTRFLNVESEMNSEHHSEARKRFLGQFGSVLTEMMWALGRIFKLKSSILQSHSSILTASLRVCTTSLSAAVEIDLAFRAVRHNEIVFFTLREERKNSTYSRYGKYALKLIAFGKKTSHTPRRCDAHHQRLMSTLEPVGSPQIPSGI